MAVEGFEVEGWEVHSDNGGEFLEVLLYDKEGSELRFLLPKRIAKRFGRRFVPEEPTVPGREVGVAIQPGLDAKTLRKRRWMGWLQ